MSLCLRWAVPVGRLSLSLTRTLKNVISGHREIITEILHPLHVPFVAKHIIASGRVHTDLL